MMFGCMVEWKLGYLCAVGSCPFVAEFRRAVDEGYHVVVHPVK